MQIGSGKLGDMGSWSAVIQNGQIVIDVQYGVPGCMEESKLVIDKAFIEAKLKSLAPNSPIMNILIMLLDSSLGAVAVKK